MVFYAVDIVQRRIQSKISDGIFLRKQLTAETRYLFSEKASS